MDSSNTRPRRARAVLAFACSLATAGLCVQPAAAATARDEMRATDPFEGINRVIFYFNGALDFLFIRPAAITYKRVTPRPIRTAIHNVFANMGEPTVLINDVLQGHGKTAVRTLGRFAEDSTLGVGGVFDVATRSGLTHHNNDFGITLARFGVKSGPYIVVPIMGPGTVRDGIGEGVNLFLDPFTYLRFTGSEPFYIARTVGNGLDERAASDKDVKVIEATATDIYASIRSYYLQNREADITGGKLDIQTLPDFGDPTGGAPASANPPPASAPQPPTDPFAAPPAVPSAAPPAPPSDVTPSAPVAPPESVAPSPASQT